ncbi:MAG TPA: diguanylate cyclase, partial [Anaeromyxobacteraceae bacterium]
MTARAAQPLPAPARAAVRSARDVRSRLSAQRPRPLPLLVSAYAALLGDAGVAGPPARRRAARFVARSVPAAVMVGMAALLALRVFGDVPLGIPQAIAATALAATLGGVAWRRAAAVRLGQRATWRGGLELGSLVLVLAFGLAQVS